MLVCCSATARCCGLIRPGEGSPVPVSEAGEETGGRLELPPLHPQISPTSWMVNTPLCCWGPIKTEGFREEDVEEERWIRLAKRREFSVVSTV